MASYSTNDFKAGLKVMIDGSPGAVVENEFVKPGKGQAFNRVKIRNLKTGRIITLGNGIPLSVAPPHTVVLKIVKTDPGLKGDTSGGGGKPATLETGAVVRVPLFIQKGELIKCNTRTREDISRA